MGPSNVPSACVVLTRPQGKNEALAQRLEQQGFSTLLLPALDILPLLQAGDPVPVPASYQLVMFVSGQAASLYVNALGQRAGLPWPATTLAACVGQSTARQLVNDLGLPANAVLFPNADSGNDSEALLHLLQPRLGAIKRVLIVAGAHGRDWLGKQLQQRGVMVDRVELYQRTERPLSFSERSVLAQWLAGSVSPIVLLTSRQSVQAMAKQVQAAGMLDRWLTACRFLAIHSRVAQELHSVATAAGIAAMPVVKLCSPNENAIFQAIVAMASFTERS